MKGQKLMHSIHGGSAIWEAKREKKLKPSKYQPHQGKRERARRKSNANV